MVRCLLFWLVGAAHALVPGSGLGSRFFRRLGLTRRPASAVAEGERKNVTLLSCASAPEVRYLGENASLFLRYLNATRAFQLGADAEVRSESLDAEAAGAVVEALWRDRALIVHDKAAYREAIKGSKLAAQLAGGAKRAASIWDTMATDAAAARRYVARVAPALLVAKEAGGAGGEGAAAPPSADALRLLLADFKERYPYYRGKCEHCACEETDFVGEISASDVEAAEARAGRVELRACAACDRVSRFVRANAVDYALHVSKRGRCGEYSAAFLAVLVALGLEARWVWDTTDHVWCEAKIDGRWTHLDPCEASLDEPQIYSGWGKNGTLVVAFSRDAAEDVTAVYYPEQAAAVADRRDADGLTDAAVAAALAAFAARDREDDDHAAP